MQLNRLLVRSGLCILLAAFPVFSLDAQTGMLRIDWFTMDAGGGVSTSSTGLTLQGTIGQWDAAVSSSRDLRLSGGFWPSPAVDVLFTDRFER